MESISTSTPYLSQTVMPSAPAANSTTFNSQEATPPTEQSKQLQPDKIALSEEAKAKSAEENKQEKTAIDANSLNAVMSQEEADAAEKSNESDIDKRIRELSMEILELSVKIQMLQDKEDKESVKERQKLEIDLAIKKGELEATMERKLQLAAMSS